MDFELKTAIEDYRQKVRAEATRLIKQGIPAMEAFDRAIETVRAKAGEP